MQLPISPKSLCRILGSHKRHFKEDLGYIKALGRCYFHQAMGNVMPCDLPHVHSTSYPKREAVPSEFALPALTSKEGWRVTGSDCQPPPTPSVLLPMRSELLAPLGWRAGTLQTCKYIGGLFLVYSTEGALEISVSNVLESHWINTLINRSWIKSYTVPWAVF